MNENLDKGKTKESWFAETVMNGSSIAATAEYGQYLQLVSETIENANELMIDTVMTNKYEFSQCKNLDGFIAEQYHVNMFNMKALLNFLSLYCASISSSSFPIISLSECVFLIACLYDLSYGL